MKTKSVEIYRDNIAGVQYHDYQRAQLKAGTKLRLMHNPNNAHDKNAIEVWAGQYQIGHIKAADTALLHRYRRARIKLNAALVSYNKNNPSWLALVIKITAAQSLEVAGQKEELT